MASKGSNEVSSNIRGLVFAICAGIVILVASGGVWALCIVSIPPGMIGIVLQKTGRADPDGHFVVEQGYQGYQRNVLMPGRHVFWQTTLLTEIDRVPMTVIPNDKIGVLIAQDGRPLPDGRTLAEDDEIDPATGRLVKMGQKGIRQTLLKPGTYPVNPKYFVVELHDALHIREGEAAVLVRKIGDPQPPGQMLVPQASPYRGIIEELAGPGLVFLHPYIYTWEIVPAVTIPAGKIGVLIRKIGDPPPDNHILVPKESSYRGIVKEVLEPGTYLLHPYRYAYEIRDAIRIPEKRVGIVLRKVGQDPPAGMKLIDQASEYRGTIKQVLESGIYALNPYEVEVRIVSPSEISDQFVRGKTTQ